MHNGVDAVGIDQQVQHLLLLLLESTVEKQVCYNLESKQSETFSCTVKLRILFQSVLLHSTYLLIYRFISVSLRAGLLIATR